MKRVNEAIRYHIVLKLEFIIKCGITTDINNDNL